MRSLEELINLIITFAFVAAPLYIMMSRRRRSQEQQRAQQPAGGGASPVPAKTKTSRPPVRTGGAETIPAEPVDHQEDLRAVEPDRDDGGYAVRRHEQSETASSGEPAQPRAYGRLEKALREILGVPDERREQAREVARLQELARRKTITRKKPRTVAPTIASRQPFVARSVDVKIRAVMPETGSLSLSPGGMGSQQMRTAAGNLGASSSMGKHPPAPEALGPGWNRVNSLPTFKRAILLSEIFGKPHSLKDMEPDG